MFANVSNVNKIVLFVITIYTLFAFNLSKEKKIINTSTAVVVSKTSLLNDKDLINIQEFGCRGDGFQSNDFSISNYNQLCVESARFSNSDIGKMVSVAYAGENGEHLVTTIKTILTKNCVLLNSSATKNVSNVLGSYGTDNLKTLNKALNYSIQNNKKLYAPEGVYLIGDLNTETGLKWVQVSPSAAKQNIYLEGAGKGKTIFRELDGKTQRFGRYTKMIYLLLNNNYELGNVTFKNFTLDKNARSITKQLPKNIWNYEQAHSLYIAGGKRVSPKVGDVVFKNIEVYDKISTGIAWSGFYSKVKSIEIDNITEKSPSYRAHDKHLNLLGYWNAATNAPDVFRDTSKNKIGDYYKVSEEGIYNGIAYEKGETIRYNGKGWLRVVKGRLTTQNNILLGERGDLEITAFSEDIVIDNCTLSFVQIEPTENQLSSKEFRRSTKIVNSTIYSLQYTEARGSDKKYSKLYCENVTSEKYLVRSLTSTAIHCDLGITKRISSINGLISDSKIRIAYNEETNKVTSINPGYIKSNPTPNNFVFNNCSFVIDSANDNITPTGYAIKSTVVKSLLLNSVTIVNCNFDKRLYGSISAYGNGNFLIKNNQISGLTNAILVGGYKEYRSKVILENNNYKNVAVNKKAKTLTIQDGNLLYEIYINERVDESEWNVIWKGRAGGLEKLVKTYPTILVKDINRIKNSHLKGTKAEVVSSNKLSPLIYECIKKGAKGKSAWEVLKPNR